MSERIRISPVDPTTIINQHGGFVANTGSLGRGIGGSPAQQRAAAQAIVRDREAVLELRVALRRMVLAYGLRAVTHAQATALAEARALLVETEGR